MICEPDRRAQLEHAVDRLADTIDRQRERIARSWECTNGSGLQPEDMLDANGQPILGPLLAALVHGLAVLEGTKP